MLSFSTHLCRIPVPVDVIWMSPRFKISTFDSESLCVNSPLTTMHESALNTRRCRVLTITKDLKFSMRMRSEPFPGSDPILVDDSKASEPVILVVLIRRERERVERL